MHFREMKLDLITRDNKGEVLVNSFPKLLLLVGSRTTVIVLFSFSFSACIGSSGW